MTLAAKPFAAAVNHLLAREAWARERLAPYAGKTARLAFSSIVLTFAIESDGYLAAVDASDARAVDVSLAIGPDALPAFMQGGQAAVMKHVKIEGDAELATQLAKLAEHLRWEPEEDLAKLIGDAPAHRAAGLVRAAGDQALRAGRSLRDSIAEYLLDEKPQLVRRRALDAFNAELARTRDALARVEKRIERLDQQALARQAGALRRVR
ncbi:MULTISPECIES: SCP2 sterol-binding domain-containing protein [unclassified Trinickia]|jgi:ubiquinone biosynthesis protein UbiJ|uniref:ubiquinone biosynthesis accessory factor UbiJ n=1 Tax=unclassified Trinickia TaxID=2638168 RepID=UPI002405AECC|nr:MULTISPECIES: SCP2 sterol-binding domain-containing protein [unclassified Trinickia]MDG0023441.1 SCP2 sterol-binding domain-containing protein [Trinickia sp. Y13]HVW51465.1 SCP2 sterol-binding domain-containing protein [Trinickia sp.]